MKQMAADPSVQRQNLQAAYQRLTEVQRTIVQVFAIFYEPVSRVNAGRCWGMAIPPWAGSQRIKPLNVSQFSAQVTKAIQQGTLTQAQGLGPCCPELLVDIVVRDAIALGTFEPIVKAVHQQSPLKRRYATHGPRTFVQETAWLRELRIAIYREDTDEIDELLQDADQAYWQRTQSFPMVLEQVINNPFDAAWFETLSLPFRQYGLRLTLAEAARAGTAANTAFETVEGLYQDEQLDPETTLVYVEQLWLRGHLREASGVLSATPVGEQPGKYLAMQGAIAFLIGQTEDAVAHFRASLKQTGKSKGAQASWFDSPATAVFFLALLKRGQPEDYEQAAAYCQIVQQYKSHWLHDSMMLLEKVIQVQGGMISKVPERLRHGEDYFLDAPSISSLLEAYSIYWLHTGNFRGWLPQYLTRLYREASQLDYGWFAMEFATLLAHLGTGVEEYDVYGEIADALREECGSHPLLDLVKIQEPWELSLKALGQLTQATAPHHPAAKPILRLAWRLQFSSMDYWNLIPVEQKLSTKGGWTKGKQISLKRFTSPRDMPNYMTDHDRQIVANLEVEQSQYYYYGSPSYSFGEGGLTALVGHPLVFLAEMPDVRIDIVAGEPELIVKQLSSDRLRLSLLPEVNTYSYTLAFKETPTRLKVIALSDDHRRIAQLLAPNNRLEVPAYAQDQVLKAITAISSLITIQSDIGGGVAAEAVPADSTPRVHLLPAGDGLKVALLAHPFPEGGSYYRPGEGGKTVIAEVDGKRLQTERNLKAEKQQAKNVKIHCPVLKSYKPRKGEWVIEEPEDCLNLLVQLQTMGDRVRIEWPEGEKFRVSQQLGLSNFRFNIRQQQDWFAASGEIQISETQVVDLQQLMALMDKSPGNFVELSDGQFLALTDEFRKRLKTLQRLSDGKGKDLRIHGLAALALEDMVEDVAQIKVDKAWKTHLQRIKTARSIAPQVPDTLQATLRDYQLAGFTWLSRLAHWGVGACLADDMGLGKTLQAIALILTRCDTGPTLVIAPTSVCLNWASEVERFAPSLTVKSFGPGNRQQMLDALQPGDLAVCSYGLLQQEEAAALLAKVTWQNIVLDEAQAIKNQDTKRSQAAMALQGDFKILTTGTPIENHLGELWNLFRFINPGLLGSLDSFNQRFANAIERGQDEAAREALRRLIQPFILRRTKDQVLKELPSRTEITLQVELSEPEMAFYETLRREAVEKLADSDAAAGQKHLQVLAEIMRLRRACCNPQLVRPELGLPSAKLDQFGEVLGELLENGHKALVFSQFVDHLAILREYLDRQQIAYQYLDGSTPAKQRQQRVEAFQTGEGDVFLISLKAGGTGLNLTAADFVLHMDPWWNPAVEDQASDRAHRIGQQRPVTIYRLVAQGTIEDKIVALHKTKRDLADSLLAGTDVSSKISTDELLALIQA
ncbi:MAG: SNF2-related protein [Cyanobacteria bacterium P01_C01_bin.147]